MISPELQSRVQVWRQKANAGTLSIDEMREAIAALRGSRLSAANAPTKSRTTKGPAKSADDLLSELEGL